MWRVLAIIVIISVLVGSAVAWLPLAGDGSSLSGMTNTSLQAPPVSGNQIDAAPVAKAPASWDELTAAMTATAVPTANPLTPGPVATRPANRTSPSTSAYSAAGGVPAELPAK